MDRRWLRRQFLWIVPLLLTVSSLVFALLLAGSGCRRRTAAARADPRTGEHRKAGDCVGSAESDITVARPCPSPGSYLTTRQGVLVRAGGTRVTRLEDLAALDPCA